MSRLSRLFQLVLLTVILSFSSHSLIAQNDVVYNLLNQLKAAKEDTNKVFILNELCWELTLPDSDLAIKYGKSAISLASKLNYPSGKSTGLYYLSRAYQQIGENELALSQTKRALSIDLKQGNLAAIAKDHNQIGTCYKIIGNHDKAMFHYFKSLEMFEKIGNMYSASQTKLNIANFMIDRSEYAKAIQLAKEAKIEFEKAEDPIMAALAIEMMAFGSEKTGKLKEALQLFKRALTIFQNEGDIYHESENQNNIGVLYQELEEYDKALYHLNRSLEIDDSLGRKYSQSVSHANLALLYLDMNENEQSIEHINRSIALGSELGELMDVMRLMKITAEVLYESGDYKGAYDHYLIAQQMEDTLFSEKKTETIYNIKEKYETDKKEKEIIILKKERDISRSKAKLVDTVILFSIGSGLLLLIIVFFFFRNRKIKEKQRKAELEQKVLRAQMNPHFIFNSLNSIQRIFIEGDEDLANDYISDFGKLLRIIMENSGKNRVSIKNEIDTLKLYLDIEMIRLDGQIEYLFEIDPNLDLLNNFIPPLVIQPFVENAIWHGILPNENQVKGQIIVQVTRESKTLIKCCVSDNGIGINKSLAMKKSTQHTSKGMSITGERLGRAIQAEEIKTGGTKITLLIPLNL